MTYINISGAECARSKEELAHHINNLNQFRQGAYSWNNTLTWHLNGNHLWRVKETCFKRNRNTPLKEWAKQVEQGRVIELCELYEKPPEQGSFSFLGGCEGGWDYRVKSESGCDDAGIYSCPPAFFDLVPRGNQAWRDKVLAWHAARVQSGAAT